MQKIERRSVGAAPNNAMHANMDGYLAIAEHGLIGDLNTVALVGTDGTIDWYCCPRFDAPSLFGAILDKERGGYWAIAPSSAKQICKRKSGALIWGRGVYRKTRRLRGWATHGA